MYASCVDTACVYTTSAAGLSVSRHLKAHTHHFSTSVDHQHVETFLRQAARYGLWESATTVKDLVDAAGEVCLERLCVLSTMYLINRCHQNLTYRTSGNVMIER